MQTEFDPRRGGAPSGVFASAFSAAPATSPPKIEAPDLLAKPAFREEDVQK